MTKQNDEPRRGEPASRTVETRAAVAGSGADPADIARQAAAERDQKEQAAKAKKIEEDRALAAENAVRAANGDALLEGPTTIAPDALAPPKFRPPGAVDLKLGTKTVLNLIDPWPVQVVRPFYWGPKQPEGMPPTDRLYDPRDTSVEQPIVIPDYTGPVGEAIRPLTPEQASEYFKRKRSERLGKMA